MIRLALAIVAALIIPLSLVVILVMLLLDLYAEEPDSLDPSERGRKSCVGLHSSQQVHQDRKGPLIKDLNLGDDCSP
jgi:hypothetical protein